MLRMEMMVKPVILLPKLKTTLLFSLLQWKKSITNKTKDIIIATQAQDDKGIKFAKEILPLDDPHLSKEIFSTYLSKTATKV